MDIQSEYMVAIDHVEKTIDRRQNITTVYLSVNAAVLGAISFVLKDGVTWTQISTLFLLFAGIIASYIWRRLLLNYKVILNWWYGVIREIEINMDAKTKLFVREYGEIYRPEKKPSIKLGLTNHEVKLTWLFSFFYLGLSISLLVSLFTATS